MPSHKGLTQKLIRPLKTFANEPSKIGGKDETSTLIPRKVLQHHPVMWKQIAPMMRPTTTLVAPV